MITVKKELDTIDKKIIAKSAEGLTAKEIAYEIEISVHVVTGRIKAMMQYYKCKSKVQLIAKLK